MLTLVAFHRQVLEDILSPICTTADVNFTQPMYCTRWTNSLDLVYTWKQPRICRKGYTPPTTYSMNCAYVATYSPIGIAITALTLLGGLMSILYMIMLAIYRRSEPVKMASFAFCECILLGSLFMYMTPLFMTDPFVTWRCNTAVWVLVIGFGMTFGGLFVKLLRIYRIFSNRGLQILRVSDSFLFRNLMIILALEIVALLIWTFVGSGSQIIQIYLATEPILKASIYQDTCNYGSSGALAGIGVLNFILIILAIGIGFATWSVPTQFNETKVIITSVFGVTFGCVVCVPLLYFVQSASFVMIVSLTIDFVLVISMAIFCIPKLYEAIRLENRRASHSRSSSTNKGRFFWASIPHGMGLSKPKGGITIEYTKSKVISSGTKGSRSEEMERQLGKVSETSEGSAIQLEPTLMTPAARRNTSNSHDGTNNPISSRKQINFDRSTRQTRPFCPHCGLGIDECEPH
ncbi:7 transmembrane sweet-taste receptor of 3 GCPR-domain-containing protein [Endogone sp. FLAS-F59071]|nr:7 transmembrane sweet-taste receptor of 3 GCPR-domain-containing protein [Endogone sp. FLAS-F59071]|eukprot:RUS17881.1 7 transmembrane sweet-taste receptor of 3 GCPR-domain-containing protein [Endogone sp. FLAS-F59071]